MEQQLSPWFPLTSTFGSIKWRDDSCTLSKYFLNRLANCLIFVSSLFFPPLYSTTCSRYYPPPPPLIPPIVQNHGDHYPHHLQPLLPQTSQCDIDKFHRARSFLPGSLTNDPALVTFTRNTGLTKGIVPCAVVEIVIDCGSGNGSIKDNVLHQKDSTCWASKFLFSAPLRANCWQWGGWCGSTINNTSPNRSSEKRRIVVHIPLWNNTTILPDGCVPTICGVCTTFIGILNR